MLNKARFVGDSLVVGGIVMGTKEHGPTTKPGSRENYIANRLADTKQDGLCGGREIEPHPTCREE